MIEYINMRCSQWAEWHQRREDTGLGFPKECPYTRLQARGQDGYQLTIHEAAWEMHRAIHSLRADLHLAVVAFYLRRGTIEQRAGDLGYSERTLFRRIDQAHAELLGWLNDEAAGVEHPAYAFTPCIVGSVGV